MKLIIISSISLLFVQQVLARPAEGCLQNYTITDTDSCFSVAAMFKITEPEFYAMNPGLHHSAQHDCDNLDTGKPFCVCLKSPCAFPHVIPAASHEKNSTEHLIHAASNDNDSIKNATASPIATAISSYPSNLSSASPSSLHSSSIHASSPSTPSSVIRTTTAPSKSLSASSQTASSKSSASINNIFGTIIIGVVIITTSMMF